MNLNLCIKINLTLATLVLTFSLVVCQRQKHLERARNIVIFGKEKPLNARDRLNTRLHSVGTHRGSQAHLIRYTSVTTNEECVLKKIVKTIPSKPIRRCEPFQRQICALEKVLVYKTVVEDCDKEKEYCQTFFRTQNIESKTVLCQKSKEIVCDGDLEDQSLLKNANLTQICHENRVALCSTKPETVTTTEKRQRCRTSVSSDFTEKITKICITRTNGTWSCKDLTNPDEICDEVYVTKMITVEAIAFELKCHDKIMRPICHEPHCRLASKDMNCVKGSIPTQIDLKQVVCDKCVHGRSQVRPVLVDKNVCRNKTEEICVDDHSQRQTITWRKWCIDPATELPTATTTAKPKAAIPALVKIEISPGNWIETTNKTEIEFYLQVQEDNEERSK